MPGIYRSITSTSGWYAVLASMTSMPSATVATTENSPASVFTTRSSSGAWSSATSTRARRSSILAATVLPRRRGCLRVKFPIRVWKTSQWEYCMDAKSRAATSIQQAKAELDKALADIDMIRTANPALVGLVAHALSNYITVTAATVEMLQLTLRDHHDPDVPIWLEGIGHATDLMQHSVGRLVTLATPRDFPLKLDYVNIAVLMERACEYFRRRTTAKRLHISCRTVGQVPLAWGDRVALAVVVDNLLSHAVQVSKQ